MIGQTRCYNSNFMSSPLIRINAACILRNTILSPSTSTIRNQGVYILRPLDGSLLASTLSIRINAAYLLRYTILSTSTFTIRNRVLTSLSPRRKLVFLSENKDQCRLLPSPHNPFPKHFYYPKQGTYIIRPLNRSLYYRQTENEDKCRLLPSPHNPSTSTSTIRNRVLTSFVPWTEACIIGSLKIRKSAAYFLRHTILSTSISIIRNQGAYFLRPLDGSLYCMLSPCILGQFK